MTAKTMAPTSIFLLLTHQTNSNPTIYLGKNRSWEIRPDGLFFFMMLIMRMHIVWVWFYSHGVNSWFFFFCLSKFKYYNAKTNVRKRL